MKRASEGWVLPPPSFLREDSLPRKHVTKLPRWLHHHSLPWRGKGSCVLAVRKWGGWRDLLRGLLLEAPSGLCGPLTMNSTASLQGQVRYSLKQALNRQVLCVWRPGGPFPEPHSSAQSFSCGSAFFFIHSPGWWSQYSLPPAAPSLTSRFSPDCLLFAYPHPLLLSLTFPGFPTSIGLLTNHLSGISLQLK